MMRKSQVEKFDEWYNGYFLASRDPTSPILVGENRQAQVKFKRIGVVCKTIIENKDMTWEQIRKKISIELFISMRCALDYLSYSKLIIEEWEKFKKKILK